MKNNQEEKLSAEIAVVGERYGIASPVIMPIFDKREAVEPVDIKRVLGFEEVLLMPIDNNPYDDYAVEVKTLKKRKVGYVWMYQAPAVFRCAKNGKRKYIRARISRICPVAGVLTVVPELEVDMTDIERNSSLLDMQWAADLPRERTSTLEYDLCVAFEMVREELLAHPSWTPELQQYVDDLLELLPLDLSAHHYKEGYEVYNLMAQSEDAHLRNLGEIILKRLVHRGSSERMQWWSENWLPNYFQEVKHSEMGLIFQEDGYSLEQVEHLLEKAPNHLFSLYKADPKDFATRLYYSSLPLKIYNRLLTLLAVREMMRAKTKNHEEEGREKELAEHSDETNDGIISQLKPMFFGNEDEARRFLISVLGMKPKQITNLVNKYIKEKKISELSCHRELYMVLHEYGIYKPTESNWNQQVK